MPVFGAPDDLRAALRLTISWFWVSVQQRCVPACANKEVRVVLRSASNRAPLL
jgi:hypothetical protein